MNILRVNKEENKMKTVRVVAAVIRDGDKIFATQRGMEISKVDGNFLGEKLKKEKLHKQL